MADNKMPEKLISYRAYKDGKDMLGTVDVQLPDLELLSDTIKGAGIAGEIDSPTLGAYASMGLSLNWRTITGDVVYLTRQEAHQLEFRGAIQVYDAAEGKHKVVSQKIVVKAIPKKTSLGKLAVASGQETTSEFEVIYIKVFLDGKEKIEVDKLNFICKINSRDILSEVRTALGLD